MPLTFVCAGTSLDQSASQCGIWQIGELVDELLDQYKIDLSNSPMPSFELGILAATCQHGPTTHEVGYGLLCNAS